VLGLPERLRHHLTDAPGPILDCFAGTGRIHELGRDDTVGVEIEPEWASMHERTICGDSTQLDTLFNPGHFGTVATSPTYANRMCFEADTLVLTQLGYKPIDQIQTGDTVLTHRNRWRTVTGTNRHRASTVEVKGQIGWKIRCTPDHRFFARSTWSNDRSIAPVSGRFNPPKWIEAQDLEHSYWGTPNQPPAHAQAPNLPVGIAIESVEAFWWFVGFWLGNGSGSERRHSKGTLRNRSRRYSETSTAGTVSVSKGGDKIDHCDSMIRSAFGERSKRLGDVDSMAMWAVYSLPLLLWLKEHFGTHAHSKNLPGWCLSLPSVHRRGLLDGYLSADGCDTDRGNTASSVSLPMLRGFQMLAHGLGMSTGISQSKYAGEELVAGNICQVRDAYQLRLVEYKSKRTHDVEGFDWCRVQSVSEPGPTVDVFDISVEDDCSFIANGVAVHNSDIYDGRDGSARHTYRTALGRDLTVNNTGGMQWDRDYRDLHREIYDQLTTVLQPDGLLLLNMKDHRRDGQWQHVTHWHLTTLIELGFRFITAERIECPGNGHGQNLADRIEFETLLVMQAPGPQLRLL